MNLGDILDAASGAGEKPAPAEAPVAKAADPKAEPAPAAEPSEPKAE